MGLASKYFVISSMTYLSASPNPANGPVCGETKPILIVFVAACAGHVVKVTVMNIVGISTPTIIFNFLLPTIAWALLIWAVVFLGFVIGARSCISVTE